MKGNLMAILSAIPVLLLGYAEGPPDSVSGAPGENTCTKCHGGSPNTGKGSVSISFPGASYVPNQTYTIQVTVSDPNALRWGFELTARPDGNPAIEAGTLVSADGMTQTISVEALQWIERWLRPDHLHGRVDRHRVRFALHAHNRGKPLRPRVFVPSLAGLSWRVPSYASVSERIRAQGFSIRQIATKLGIGVGTAARTLQAVPKVRSGEVER